MQETRNKKHNTESVTSNVSVTLQVYYIILKLVNDTKVI